VGWAPVQVYTLDRRSDESGVVVRDELPRDYCLDSLVAVDKGPGRNRPVRATRAQAGVATWRVPERLLDEPDEFVAWARLALAAAGRVAAKRTPVPRRKSRRTSR